MSLELKWDSEQEIGYFPVDEYIAQYGNDPYDESYFKKYEGYAATELGRKLNDFRLKLVNKFTSQLVVDVGIGSGQFVEARSAMGYPTHGTDCNPVGIAWLAQRGLEADLTKKAPVVTFFDSMEHIKDYKCLVELAEKFVILTIPIFIDYKDILNSHHYRKTEHYHYFGHRGLVTTFWNLGFRLIEYNDVESELGRKGVRTYVFKRAR